MTAKDVILARKLGGGGGGGGTEITDGIVVKARDADGYAEEIDIYGDIPNYFLSWNGGYYHEGPCFSKSLRKINLHGQTIIGFGAFYGNLLVDEVTGTETVTTFPSFAATTGAFGGTAITMANYPELTALDCAAFQSCAALLFVSMPKCTSFGGGTRAAFINCTSLQIVQMGSVGYGVSNISSSLFSKDIQTGLTITVYTTAAYANTALTNIRNGATNATIIIKASEDTTYNGTSYAAGETMITSTVEEAA